MSVDFLNRRAVALTTDGQEVIIQEGTGQVYHDIKIVCEGPGCAGFDGSGPTVLEWDERKIEKGEQTLPDGFNDLLWLARGGETKHSFCGQGCMLDWLKANPVPPPPSKVVDIGEYNKQKSPVNGQPEGAA